MTTREKLLHQTILTLQKKGYYGTGIREILLATKVPKGSLYHHFPTGKAGLVSEALEQFAVDMTNSWKESLKKKNPVKGLQALVQFIKGQIVQSEFTWSELVTLCALELTESEPDIVRQGAAIHNRWLGVLHKYLLKRKVVDHDLKASTLFSQLLGAIIRTKIDRDVKHLDALHDRIPQILG